jgi:asparagine synthase (glutamine-hydrolysing)
VPLARGPGTLKREALEMCGICGVVQVGGEPRELVSPEQLDAMTDVMTHRGPNDRGTYAAPGIALGVRRLSIVDVEGGHQPFLNEEGSVVAIQNGELYNHDDLRRGLQRDGHVFASRCDTEILPHLYERDGARFPEVLRGKFGIAVWDERRRRAVLARDRMGVKPLYWARVGDVVVFASELKSVLASGFVEPELDLEAIDLYFSLGFVPGPRTPLVAVRKLAPGSILSIGPDAVHEEPYWAYPEPSPDSRPRPLEDYADELLDLLRQAVTDRLMSDVPLGAMLSGGLDSSLVVALMAEASSRPVVTFSVGFREDKASELGDARRVAQAFGCEHHELELSVTENAVDIDDLAWRLDEPVADLSALGFDVLSRLAAEHVTVALAGQGADELFGGYTKHRAAATIASLGAVPAAVRTALAGLPWPSPRMRRALGALAAGDPSARLLAMSGRLVDGVRADLYGDALARVRDDNAYATIEALRGGLDGNPLAVTLYLDARLGLVDHMLLYFDRTSMAHSLEVRVPYLDHRLVEWAATVPASMKVQRGVTKRVLKEAGMQLLPPQTVRKPKVGFFRSALDVWLHAQLAGPAGERLRAGDAAYLGLLNGSAVAQLVADYRHKRTEDAARLVFAILLLESWLSTFTHPRAAART